MRLISLFAPLLQNNHIKGQCLKFDGIIALQIINARSLQICELSVEKALIFMLTLEHHVLTCLSHFNLLSTLLSVSAVLDISLQYHHQFGKLLNWCQYSVWPHLLISLLQLYRR